ncbi:MAG: heme-binding domain-containing protein [Leptospiraceae bacterium]|nr:heme-binding domain-containing protein [Leptospiraceae bacterium]
MKKKIIYTVIGIFLLLQLIPVNRDNPKIENDLFAPDDVKAILKKSCYDCHSNETIYPIYSYIFPISILLAHHIEEGREELNFSNWELYSNSKKSTKAKEIIEEIKEKEMPLYSYTLFHSGAILTPDEIRILSDWAEEIQIKNESED